MRIVFILLTMVIFTISNVFAADVVKNDLIEQFKDGFRNDDDYVFDATGRTDPFLPPEAIRGGDLAQSEKEIAMTLAQFNLVAIVHSDDKKLALFEDAAGIGYILNEGDIIGADGLVDKIHKSTVEVKVLFKNIYGYNEEKTVVVELHKEE